MIIAKVAVENTSYNFDMAYDYLVPIDLSNKAKPGCRVLVMFGGGKRARQGLIMEISEMKEIPNYKKMKSIIDVLDTEPLLNKELLKLVGFMKKRYFCTLFDAVKLMYPSGLNCNSQTYYKLVRDINFSELLNLTETQNNIIKLLASHDGKIKEKELLRIGDSKDIALLEKSELIQKHYANIRKVSDKLKRMVRLLENKSDIKLTQKQKIVYDLISDLGEMSIKEVCYYTGVGINVVDRMQSKGLVEYFDKQIYRIPYTKIKFIEENELVLSKEQLEVFTSLLHEYKLPKSNVHLLYGVTGSGKTSIFLKLIDEVIADNKNVILMVPEIALTSQLIALFRARYGEYVAVFHSGLSMGERLDEWKRVKNGLANIAIGTRSAVFAPFENLGLIIIDEEQEGSYKSGSNPRFHARDIAKYRCLNNNAMLLLSSATPSIESYYMAQNKRYSLSRLETRYGNAQLPSVDIVDMNLELLNGNDTAFSMQLLDKLRENIDNNCQSILLLNRRGYNTFASCRACNHVITCPNCSISMTYHHANNRLMCHYCGYSIEFTNRCPNCNSSQVKYSGYGTQKVEQDLNEYLSDARILRMDADTTMAKYSHAEKLNSFASGEYDILIGTQMVAKGLNFPNVTLVGVLLADQTLYSDDFRSYEHAFDLLTQVVGRGGRGIKPGHAIIQTFTPENPIIGLAADQNYDEFYNSELAIRKALLYPPFVDICVIGFAGLNEDLTREASKYFLKSLKCLSQKSYRELPMRVLGPTAATIPKVNNKYRFRMIIKCKNNKRFRKMISDLLIEFSKHKQFKNVSVFADINPDSTI